MAARRTMVKEATAETKVVRMLAQVVMAAALLPAALLGLWGSMVVNRRIQHSHLQVMVLALGAIAGIGAIAQALLL